MVIVARLESVEMSGRNWNCSIRLMMCLSEVGPSLLMDFRRLCSISIGGNVPGLWCWLSLGTIPSKLGLCGISISGYWWDCSCKQMCVIHGSWLGILAVEV